MLPITGDTYDIREQLKGLGCRWDDAQRFWSAPDETIRAEGQALADAEPWRKWRGFMDGLTWATGSFTTTGWEAGLNACSRGIPLAAAMEEIGRRIEAAGGKASPSWLRRNVGRAYEKAEPPRERTIGQSDNRTTGARRVAAVEAEEEPEPAKPVYSQGKLEAFAGAWARACDTAWLADRSPVDPLQVTAGGFLSHLYQASERVVIFDVFASQGQWLWDADKACAGHDAAEGFVASVVDHEAWGADKGHVAAPPVREGKAFTGSGPQGLWYLCNPVDGAFRQTAEQDNWDRPKWSRRFEECVTSWRYFVLESDEADPREWVGAMVQLPLPIAAIYTSGGGPSQAKPHAKTSVHVLVRVDAGSKAQFDMWRETAKRTMIPLGADRGCMSAVRLTRLPGCVRELDKDGEAWPGGPRTQKLLYLDPSASAEPISRRSPLRDSLEVWEHWVRVAMEYAPEEMPAADVAKVEYALKWYRGERANGLLAQLRRWKG